MKSPALFKRFKTLLRNTSHRSRRAASAEVDTSSTDHTPTSTAQFTGAVQVTGSGEIAGHVASESRDPASEKVESTCSTSADGCEVIVTAPQMQKELKFNAPFSAEFPLGCLGRFQIKERLGNGLHGRVFRAFDPGLDREVAIKVINPTHQATELALIAEARRTSTSHPNLVHIHEVRCVTVDEVDVHFLVLDLIKGSTLNEKMSQPISVSQAIEWIDRM